MNFKQPEIVEEQETRRPEGFQSANETGFYYYRARYYDPKVGRFLGVDKLDYEHLYTYVRNNPLSLVDPSGLFPEPGHAFLFPSEKGGEQ